MKNRISFSIGTDPEFFLKSGDKYVAALNYITGTKESPTPLTRGHAVMFDNVAMEFTTKPASFEKQFIRHIAQALRSVRKLLPDDITIVAEPSAMFEKDELDYPQCQEFGCSPDFNAYTNGERNTPPKNARKSALRSCGAHIHVGHESLIPRVNKILMVQTMDMIHGLGFTVLDHSPESVRRRKLYGKAGCFRPTDYGIEYRTLSNFWVKAPDLVRLVYRFTGEALNFLISENVSRLLGGVSSKEVIETINSGDAPMALKLFSEKVAPLISEKTRKHFEYVSEKEYDFSNEWSI